MFVRRLAAPSEPIPSASDQEVPLFRSAKITVYGILVVPGGTIELFVVVPLARLRMPTIWAHDGCRR